MEIKYFSRLNNKIEIEKVYGDSFIQWMYGSTSGKILSNLMVRGPLSSIYGVTQSTKLSSKKVAPFIKDFNIDMDQFVPADEATSEIPYPSFNDFFIRRFKEGKRNFPAESSVMGAFAEARYYGYDSIQDDETIPVKGTFLNAKELLANEKWTDTFHDGPLLLARLCPVDYHRFHSPLDSKVLDYYKVRGELHSVNPIALKKKADIFSKNLREVTILETEEFGKIAYVEVGAMMVGKVVQSGDLKEYRAGQEKGYFLFGGSTVIVIGEKGKWKPSSDISDNTKKGIETYIQLGDEVAKI